MLGAIAEKLGKIDVYAAADREKQTIEFESFGKKGVLQLPDFTVSGDIAMWHHLAVLQYLEAEPQPCRKGEWVPISSLEPGDVMRGESFDREISSLAASKLGKMPAAAILYSCRKLGAIIITVGDGIQNPGSVDIQKPVSTDILKSVNTAILKSGSVGNLKAGNAETVKTSSVDIQKPVSMDILKSVNTAILKPGGSEMVRSTRALRPSRQCCRSSAGIAGN